MRFVDDLILKINYLISFNWLLIKVIVLQEVRKEIERQVAPVCELQPCDARLMLEKLPTEPDLVLEMSHLGRGVQYYDEEVR